MKAKVTNLPDEDHVMRYVPWTRLDKDEDDNVRGFLPQAFELRDDEDGLSVNWVEYHDGDWETRIQASVNAIRGSFERGIGKKSAFGIGNVGKIKETCLASGARVRVIHAPKKPNLAHAEIRRLPRDYLTLLQALADDVFADIVYNSAIA
jgi:hypothetical protein